MCKIMFGWCLFLGMQIILCGVSPAREEKGMDVDLEAYQWKNRILVVFAESEETGPFKTQKRILKNEEDGVLDRDLIIVEVIENGESRARGVRFPEETAGNLRRQFQVAPGAFQVILIGKDGGEKLRRGEPVSAADLFGIIDAMPMRQQEMRQKN